MQATFCNVCHQNMRLTPALKIFILLYQSHYHPQHLGCKVSYSLMNLSMVQPTSMLSSAHCVAGSCLRGTGSFCKQTRLQTADFL